MSETDDDSDIDLEFFHRFELHLDSNNNNNTDTNRIQVVEESRDRWPRFCLGTLFPKLGIVNKLFENVKLGAIVWNLAESLD